MAPTLAASSARLSLPRPFLGPVHERVRFSWAFADLDAKARGEGIARVAGPDSARLDFFLAGGFGSGWAVLIGDSLRTPPLRAVAALVPPPPLLWAALGRLSVPPAADTVASVSADSAVADIGIDPRWRVRVRDDRLVGLSYIVGGRETERLTRTGAEVRYQQLSSGRTLTLTITRVDTLAGFDASIWHP